MNLDNAPEKKNYKDAYQTWKDKWLSCLVTPLPPPPNLSPT